MKKIKPQTPKGVRDYLPQDNGRREHIITVLKKWFELYGFQSIYTPSFERLETLQGKYGEEGDKLLFKILNSGQYMSDKAKEELTNEAPNYFALTKEISSKGLRYDLTVPLARFVSQHQNDLTFPFKRYHVAPVWRADRPQKGRYQEFFQCDVDVVGTKGLSADVDLLNLINDIFGELDVKVEIKLNNRKVFNGICSCLNIEKNAQEVSILLDKIDKIGIDKAKEEIAKIVGENKSNELIDLLNTRDLNLLKGKNEELDNGIEELNYITKHTSKSVVVDLKLLRGLDYYTGTVLEVVSTEMTYGSICGGGRYDDLTEMFGLKDMSGIGISFGLDRIYDVMTELDRFPKENNSKKVLILNLTENAETQYYSLLREIRAQGVSVDLFPKNTKMNKQLSYAEKSGYSHAIIIGDQELENMESVLKNLSERTQNSFLDTESIIKGIL